MFPQYVFSHGQLNYLSGQNTFHKMNNCMAFRRYVFVSDTLNVTVEQKTSYRFCSCVVVHQCVLVHDYQNLLREQKTYCRCCRCMVFHQCGPKIRKFMFLKLLGRYYYWQVFPPILNRLKLLVSTYKNQCKII